MRLERENSRDGKKNRGNRWTKKHTCSSEIDIMGSKK